MQEADIPLQAPCAPLSMSPIAKGMAPVRSLAGQPAGRIAFGQRSVHQPSAGDPSRRTGMSRDDLCPDGRGLSAAMRLVNTADGEMQLTHTLAGPRLSGQEISPPTAPSAVACFGW